MKGRLYKIVWLEAARAWNLSICADGAHFRVTTQDPGKLDDHKAWMLVGDCDGKCNTEEINLPKRIQRMLAGPMTNEEIDLIFHLADALDISYAFAKVPSLDGQMRFYLSTHLSEVTGLLKVQEDLMRKTGFIYMNVLELEPEAMLELNSQGKLNLLTERLAIDLLRTSRQGVVVAKLIGQS